MLHKKHRFEGFSYRWWPAKPLKKRPHPQPLSRGERGVFRQSLKDKVALEAVRETKTLNEIGQEYGVHPVQVKLLEKRVAGEGQRGV